MEGILWKFYITENSLKVPEPWSTSPLTKHRLALMEGKRNTDVNLIESNLKFSQTMEIPRKRTVPQHLRIESCFPNPNSRPGDVTE